MAWFNKNKNIEQQNIDRAKAACMINARKIDTICKIGTTQRYSPLAAFGVGFVTGYKPLARHLVPIFRKMLF